LNVSEFYESKRNGKKIIWPFYFFNLL
jgi:hypothetical protein